MAELGRGALRLYLIADTGLVPPARLPDAVRAALRGGVTVVQLRAKAETTREQVELARLLAAICREHGAPFVVNDRVDVALAAGAGVHVGHIGREDMQPADARTLMGAGALVGVSVGSPAEARAAERAGASYVSAGAMFATATKADAGPAAGTALLREVRAATALPVVAIGGITADRAREILAAGADGVCVARGILGEADPERAARAYASIVLLEAS